MSIDWTDGKNKISKYFTVREMIYFPRWNRLAEEKDGLTDEIKTNLITLAKKMDVVREYFNTSIIVHVCYRSPEYNKLIGGARKSSHIDGLAIDFHFIGKDCDDVRKIINDNKLLDTWEMRMEDLPGSNWIHLDERIPGPSGRFFKP